MNVLVIGATGGTGQLVVSKLLDAGHQVTALARRPAAVRGSHERLSVLEGDARDATSIARAVHGQDAVLSAFGPRSLKKDDLQETLMRNLVAAMVQHGVKRLVNLSAWGSLTTRDSVPAGFKLIRATLLRSVYADKDRGEAVLLASDLDFVNVSPGRLTNASERGGVRASLDGKGIGAAISRADLAQFMIEQLASDQWLRKSPVIGY
jgi:putative NADH-flavin reductase